MVPQEVLRSVLHTILFTRALGKVKPVEVRHACASSTLACVTCVPCVIICVCRIDLIQYESDVLSLSYARCGVADMDKQVEEAIELFATSLSPVGPDLSRGTLVLAFFEKRKRYLFGVAKSVDKVYWEQWSIPVVVNHRARPAGDSEVAGACSVALLPLLACASHPLRWSCWLTDAYIHQQWNLLGGKSLQSAR